MAAEWDVFQMLPGTAAPVLLATLYEASQKSIRVELDGSGSGSFAVNRTSPECTEAILAQGNLVKVRIPEIDIDYIFAFFLETGDFTLISSQETGGEMLTFGGRGILAYTEYARAWSESFIDGGQDPIAGVWRAYAAGTGNAPGQILRRLLEEFQDPDRPQQPLPLLTIDFDYDNDSTGDPWDDSAATEEFSYQVGEDGLAIVQRLLETNTLAVQMGPDFLLQAYNRGNFGRSLAGDAFGAGVVRFERGVNIATELRREWGTGGGSLGGGGAIPDTHMLAQGEADKYGTAALSTAADRVTKEGFIAAFGTGITALDGIAAVELQTRLSHSDTIMFPIANRRTEVSLGDPVTVGSVVGENALTGFYLPGPEGTNGDFWVGDTVRVHTGSGPFDYTEVDALVTAITIAREDDAHELTVVPELRTAPTPIVPGAVLMRAVTDDDQPAYLAATNPLGGTGLFPIAWTCSGDLDEVPDDPACSGTPEPTTGPLHTLVGRISDPPGGSSTGPFGHYLGWVFEAAGTIDIDGYFQVFGALGGITQYVEILIDGVVAATGSVVSGGAQRIHIVATGIVIPAAGSVLTARYYHVGTGAFYIDTPGGEEAAVQMRITGGSLFA